MADRMARLRGLRDAASARAATGVDSGARGIVDTREKAMKSKYLLPTMRVMGFIVTAIGMYSTSTAIQNFNRKKEGDKTQEEKNENIANIVFLVVYVLFALGLMGEIYSSYHVSR